MEMTSMSGEKGAGNPCFKSDGAPQVPCEYLRLRVRLQDDYGSHDMEA